MVMSYHPDAEAQRAQPFPEAMIRRNTVVVDSVSFQQQRSWICWYLLRLLVRFISLLFVKHLLTKVNEALIWQSIFQYE